MVDYTGIDILRLDDNRKWRPLSEVNISLGRTFNDMSDDFYGHVKLKIGDKINGNNIDVMFISVGSTKIPGTTQPVAKNTLLVYSGKNYFVLPSNENPFTIQGNDVFKKIFWELSKDMSPTYSIIKKKGIRNIDELLAKDRNYATKEIIEKKISTSENKPRNIFEFYGASGNPMREIIMDAVGSLPDSQRESSNEFNFPKQVDEEFLRNRFLQNMQFIEKTFSFPDEITKEIFFTAFLVRDGSVILSGIPGTGKTTLINLATELFCNSYGFDPSKYVPPIMDLTTKDIPDFIFKEMSGRETQILPYFDREKVLDREEDESKNEEWVLFENKPLNDNVRLSVLELAGPIKKAIEDDAREATQSEMEILEETEDFKTKNQVKIMEFGGKELFDGLGNDVRIGKFINTTTTQKFSRYMMGDYLTDWEENRFDQQLLKEDYGVLRGEYYEKDLLRRIDVVKNGKTKTIYDSDILYDNASYPDKEALVKWKNEYAAEMNFVNNKKDREDYLNEIANEMRALGFERHQNITTYSNKQWVMVNEEEGKPDNDIVIVIESDYAKYYRGQTVYSGVYRYRKSDYASFKAKGGKPILPELDNFKVKSGTDAYGSILSKDTANLHLAGKTRTVKEIMTKTAGMFAVLYNKFYKVEAGKISKIHRMATLPRQMWGGSDGYWKGKNEASEKELENIRSGYVKLFRYLENLVYRSDVGENGCEHRHRVFNARHLDNIVHEMRSETGTIKGSKKKTAEETLYTTEISMVQDVDATGKPLTQYVFQPVPRPIVTQPFKFINEANRLSEDTEDALLGLVAERQVEYRGEIFDSPHYVIFADLNPHKCQAANSMVMIRRNGEVKKEMIGEVIDELMDAYVPIIDGGTEELKIDVGIEILSFDRKSMKLGWITPSAFFRHKNDVPMIKVKTFLGKESLATISHSFVTIDDDGNIIGVDGKDLKIGDFLPIANYCDYGENENLDVDYDLDIGPYVDDEKYLNGDSFYNGLLECRSGLSSVKQVALDCGVSDSTIRRYMRFGYNFEIGYIYNSKVKSNGPVGMARRIKLDEDFGFLLGGYISEGNCSSSAVKIHNNCESYRKDCEKKFGGVMRDGNRVSSLEIQNKILRDFLVNSCGDNSGNKRLPNFVYTAPDSFMKGMIRSLIDGDGNLCMKTGMLRYASKSKRLCEDLDTVLKRLGITGRIVRLYSKRYDVTTYQLKYSAEDTLKILEFIGYMSISGNDFRKNVLESRQYKGRGHYEKYPILENVLSSLRKKICKRLGHKNRLYNNARCYKKYQKGMTRYCLESILEGTKEFPEMEVERCKLKGMMEGDIRWDYITLIEPYKCDDKYVYDFGGTKEDRNFVANGIVVHNSASGEGLDIATLDRIDIEIYLRGATMGNKLFLLDLLYGRKDLLLGKGAEPSMEKLLMMAMKEAINVLNRTRESDVFADTGKIPRLDGHGQGIIPMRFRELSSLWNHIRSIKIPDDVMDYLSLLSTTINQTWHMKKLVKNQGPEDQSKYVKTAAQGGSNVVKDSFEPYGTGYEKRHQQLDFSLTLFGDEFINTGSTVSRMGDKDAQGQFPLGVTRQLGIRFVQSMINFSKALAWLRRGKTEVTTQEIDDLFPMAVSHRLGNAPIGDVYSFGIADWVKKLYPNTQDFVKYAINNYFWHGNDTPVYEGKKGKLAYTKYLNDLREVVQKGFLDVVKAKPSKDVFKDKVNKTDTIFRDIQNGVEFSHRLKPEYKDYYIKRAEWVISILNANYTKKVLVNAKSEVGKDEGKKLFDVDVKNIQKNLDIAQEILRPREIDIDTTERLEKIGLPVLRMYNGCIDACTDDAYVYDESKRYVIDGSGTLTGVIDKLNDFVIINNVLTELEDADDAEYVLLKESRRLVSVFDKLGMKYKKSVTTGGSEVIDWKVKDKEDMIKKMKKKIDGTTSKKSGFDFSYEYPMVENDAIQMAIGSVKTDHGKLSIKFSPKGKRQILISFGCYRDYIYYNSFRYGDSIKNVQDIPSDREEYKMLF